jgi:hypothetical protein
MLRSTQHARGPSRRGKSTTETEATGPRALLSLGDERFLMPGSVPAELGAAAGRDFAGAVAVGEDLAEV